MDRVEVEKRKKIMHDIKVADEERRLSKKKWYGKRGVTYCYENVYFRNCLVAVERKEL